MAYDPGEVWWGPAPHKSGPSYRPWVLISESTHPFSDTECIALAMTTQPHPSGIDVADGDWVKGGSEKDSYISPWYVTTIKYRDIDRHQGELDPNIVASAVEDLHAYSSPTNY